MKTGNEDWDFWLSIIELGKLVHTIPKTVFYYRIRNNSMVRTTTKVNKKDIRKTIYLNHIELYAKYFPDPINLYYEKIQLEKKYSQLVKSLEYKVGYYLLKPIRLFYKLISNK